MKPTKSTYDIEKHEQKPSENAMPLENKTAESKVHYDQKYITALLNNDTALLNELYQKYSGKIKLMILQNNGTETDAADIFQDALLSIYHKAKTENFILTCPFDAFIYLICKNRWMSELNKKKSYKLKLNVEEVNEKIGDNSFELIEELRLQQARKDLLTEKFEQLSESSKELLRFSWSGKSMEEVAQILRRSYGYVRKKKSKCMAKLITLVKQSEHYKAVEW